MADLETLKKAVEAGKRKDAEAAATAALAAGVAPGDLVSKALIPAMASVGEKFQKGEAFVPEMLVSAKAMKAAMEIIRPKLVGTSYQPLGKIIIGTVRGDLHDIGKNLVKMMMEGAGFEVVDLGVNVEPEKFVEAVKQHSPQVLAMSALLTTTMLSMPETIKALKGAGLREKVKVIIGGAPITDSFSKEIGADGYKPDAFSAATLAKELVGKK